MPNFSFKKFLFYLGAQLIDNVVLVSDVQQSDSVIPLHVPIFFKLFTHLDYCRILNGPPCALTAGPFIALFQKLRPMASPCHGRQCSSLASPPEAHLGEDQDLRHAQKAWEVSRAGSYKVYPVNFLLSDLQCPYRRLNFRHENGER